MKQWQQQQIEQVTQGIVSDFLFLNHYFKERKDCMYAGALTFDRTALQATFVASGYNTLKKNHRNRKWLAHNWLIMLDLSDITETSLDHFCTKAVQHYRNDLAPLFPNFDFEEEEQSNIEMYIEGLKQAKIQIVRDFKIDPTQLIFFATHLHYNPTDTQTVIDSARYINEPCELLDELIEFYTNDYVPELEE